MPETKTTKEQFLLSSDSLSGFGLDLIFEVTKNAGFDWLDLAIWKNFDARNVEYVKKLSLKHELPVKVIQTSPDLNKKELDKALDLCEALGADTIAINPPKYFNYKSFDFIKDNLGEYIKQNEHIHFTIINPPNSSFFALPIPKYRFSNVVEIIKKFGCYLGLDVVHIDEDALESDFMRKLADFVPYISVLYFSDKTRMGVGHILPGEGVLKLPTLLKKLKQNNYGRYLSTKITLSKSDLSDGDKVDLILKKARKYYTEYFEEIA